MKKILEFNCPEENEEFELANKALDYHCAITDIAYELFRPARKHGYSDPKLQNLTEEQIELIGILEDKFYQILKDRKIDNV